MRARILPRGKKVKANDTIAYHRDFTSGSSVPLFPRIKVAAGCVSGRVVCVLSGVILGRATHACTKLFICVPTNQALGSSRVFSGEKLYSLCLILDVASVSLFGSAGAKRGFVSQLPICPPD